MTAPLRKVRGRTVTLAHGGGGKAMKDLIDDVFVRELGAPDGPLEDQARLDLAALTARGDRLAFTTDAYVVDPLFFPGGDLGSLAVYGTVNDLAVGGAVPCYLSCAVILEEGLEVERLRRLVRSMAEAARRAGVAIVTGDTKVVPRGACDKIFITTAGVGVIARGRHLAADRARPGDVVIVNGWLGDHGAAILGARGDLKLESPIESDCAPLHGLIEALLAAAPGTRCLRDATRGGVATVCNEIAGASGVALELEEDRTPLRAEVRGFCELLGLDPLYLANEGKLVAIVPAAEAAAAVAAMAAHPLGAGAVAIGAVTDGPPGRVTMRTVLGGHRIVDMLVGEQLPEDLLMHELGITRNIVAIVGEAARGRRVVRITLEVGALAGVMTDAIAFCFDVVAKGTPVEGARLDFVPRAGTELSIKTMECEEAS